MSRAPAFQLYAADFYMDTITWELDELGSYLRLLLYEWINGPLDPDQKVLAGICGYRDKNWKRSWNRIWLKIGSKFTQKVLTKFSHLAQYDDSFLVNIRLETEREKQIKYSESQRDNVNKRWHTEDTTVLPSNTIGNTLLSSSSSSLNTKRIKPSQHSHVAYTQEFENFWTAYPNRNGKKVGKRAAFDLFQHLDNGDRELIIKAAGHYAASSQAQGNFAKDAERFFRKDFWRDWLEPEKQGEEGKLDLCRGQK